MDATGAIVQPLMSARLSHRLIFCSVRLSDTGDSQINQTAYTITVAIRSIAASQFRDSKHISQMLVQALFFMQPS